MQLLGCVFCAIVFIQKLHGLCCRLHSEVAWFVLSSSYRNCVFCAVVIIENLRGLCCLHKECSLVGEREVSYCSFTV
jgi:hypothetical protein